MEIDKKQQSVDLQSLFWNNNYELSRPPWAVNSGSHHAPDEGPGLRLQSAQEPEEACL